MLLLESGFLMVLDYLSSAALEAYGAFTYAAVQVKPPLMGLNLLLL